jgi:hypothetical protein
MPVINIPQAQETLYASLLNPRQRRATAEATEAQAKLAGAETNESNQRSRLIQQSADYLDQTGESEASQKDTQFNVDYARIDAQLQEIKEKASEAHLKNINDFQNVMGAIYQYTRTTATPDNPQGDQEGAKQLWDSYQEGFGVSKDFKDHNIEYDPRIVQAFGTSKQVNDPTKPIAMLRKSDGKNYGIMPDDLLGMKQAMKRGDTPISVSIQPTSLEGLAGDKTALREYTEAELSFGDLNALLGTIKKQLNDPAAASQIGTAGNIQRNIQSFASQAASVMSELNQKIAGKPLEEKEGVKPTYGNSSSYKAEMNDLISKIDDPQFKEQVTKSAGLQYNIKLLAYVMAQGLQRGNRGLNDYDVKFQLENMNIGSVDQLNSIIDEISGFVKGKKERYEAIMQSQGGGIPKVPTTFDDSNSSANSVPKTRTELPQGDVVRGVGGKVIGSVTFERR